MYLVLRFDICQTIRIAFYKMHKYYKHQRKIELINYFFGCFQIATIQFLQAK